MSRHEIDVVRRLERLERENRRLRRAGLAAVTLTGVAFLVSASAVCKTVWAERFVLRDTANRERAVLTAYETGGRPQLSLLDERGQAALTFGLADDGLAFMELPGEAGPVRHAIRLSADGLLAPAKPAATSNDTKGGGVALR